MNTSKIQILTLLVNEYRFVQKYFFSDGDFMKKPKWVAHIKQ